MKTIMVFLHLLNGEVAKVPASIAINQCCSDVVDKITVFKENSDYTAGNGEVWIHRVYEDKKVWATYCKTKDEKEWVSCYYDQR